jgi:hypothetical protein
MSFSVENFKDLRDRNTVFDPIMAYRGQNHVLTGGDRPERLNGREVTAGMFDTLRIRPILGRPVTKGEDKVGAQRVVLLGEGFWTRRFARDPGVLNQKLMPVCTKKLAVTRSMTRRKVVTGCSPEWEASQGCLSPVMGFQRSSFLSPRSATWVSTGESVKLAKKQRSPPSLTLWM